jgi:YesN/AraC family two-component response regulator
MNRSFYALVISDLRMPVINGIQLLKTVKDLNPRVRTVLLAQVSTQLHDFELQKQQSLIEIK